MIKSTYLITQDIGIYPLNKYLDTFQRAVTVMITIHPIGTVATNLSDQVSDSILASILDGTIKRGQRLTAGKVANWLGVSRTPVREAFMLLCERGLLEKDSSRSYIVARGNKQDVIELAQLRVALESLSLELAMEYVLPEDVDILESIVMQMEGAAERKDFHRLVELDLQFHTTLWKIAGNTRLEQILEVIKYQVNYFMLLTRIDDKFDYPADHREIIEVLTSGNIDHAKDVMKMHIMSPAKKTIARLEME
jgi:DNA-binding GntR family transcriptional regulator